MIFLRILRSRAVGMRAVDDFVRGVFPEPWIGGRFIETIKKALKIGLGLLDTPLRRWPYRRRSEMRG